MPHPARRALALAAATALAATPLAHGIVYRNDMTDALSLGLANQDQFKATGIVGGAAGSGTGTLILNDWVITAKHVVNGDANGTTSATFKLGSVTYTGAVYSNPANDFALIHLTSGVVPASAATPIAPGFFGGESGKFVWLVGYGGHGPVSQSGNGGANLSYDFVLHAGTNVVREYSNPFLYFDNGGTGATSSVYESSTAPGDSGGPMFQQVNNTWYVIGEVNGAGTNGFIHTPTNPNSAFILSTIRSVKNDPTFAFATPTGPTNLTWDADVTVDGTADGAGTWDVQRTTFRNAITGFNYQYDNAMNDDVTFGAAGGAAGTVTIQTTNVTSGTLIAGGAGPVYAASGVTAHSLTFNAAGSGTYTIAAGTGATLTLASNGSTDPTLTANVNAEISAPIASTAATLTKAGVGTLVLSGTNTFTGSVAVNAGTLQGKLPAALPGYDTAGRYSVAGGATLAVNVGGAAEFTAAQIDALRSAATFAADSSIGLDTSSAAFAYASALSGNVGLTKLGVNALTLSAVQTYTGTTLVKGGTLKFTALNGLPSAGAAIVNSGGTLELDGYSGSGTTIANALTLAGNGAAGTRGALLFNSGNIGVYNLTGGITLAGNTTIGSYAVSHTVNFNAAIGGTGNLAFNVEGGSVSSHTFTANFNAANAYAGDTTLVSGNGNRGVYVLGVDNALPTGTVLTLQPAAGTLTFNLNARKQTVAGLASAGTAANATITATGGTGLTVNDAADYAFAGKITGKTAITKQGTGTQTLSGANDYTGLTTVDGGTLSLGRNAFAPALTNAGGADVRRGKLVFDYSGGGTDPVATVKSLLTSGYAGSFATGQIRSTTATTARGLGYADSGTAVTVAATLYGDADLDFDVDFNDFLALQNSYGQSGTTFAQGDFNYDGKTDFNDFLALQNNYGQSVLPDVAVAVTAEQIAALTAFAANAVPEPATLAALGLVGLLGLRRRGRTN